MLAMTVTRPMARRGTSRLLAAAVVMLWAWVAHADDRREVEARKRFASGQYQEALNLFVELFGETADPILLRNIGRCYQKLGQPDLAIDRFREYLRRARSLTAGEKEEIEGYIREMEALKAEQARTRPADRPVVLEPARPPPSGPSLVTAAEPTAPADTGQRPLYKSPWLWAGVGAVILGGVLVAVIATRPQQKGCDKGYTCL